MSNFSLTGKTVIVTGGAGGLGRAMVTAYAQAGANVVVASRNQEKIEAEAAKFAKNGRARSRSRSIFPMKSRWIT
ncbi:MAG: SDR family NAD(P)-dependent oxidoreductase [Pseudomonadales bacterium]|jgi:NAD(P)-dependent dehydrogenase (short-subunit alcohol dehydrogenase family)